MIKTVLLLLITFISYFNVFNTVLGQNHELPLWKKIPNSIENKDYEERFRLDKQGKPNGILKVTNPTLKAYLVDNNNDKNTAVVICPGGAYRLLSHIKEGEKIAEWFNALGVSAFVLKYRLPSSSIMKDRTIGSLQDVQEAIRTLRRNAKKWNLNPDKIGVIGFSAGGHLASTVSTHFKDKVYVSDTISARPDFSMLIYPVISMQEGITHGGSRSRLLGKNPSKELIEFYSNEMQVNENTPPTILIHATDDRAVSVENSINYYLALKTHKVPAELHIYQDGSHGFGLGRGGNYSHNQWPAACENWLRINKFIP